MEGDEYPEWGAVKRWLSSGHRAAKDLFPSPFTLVTITTDPAHSALSPTYDLDDFHTVNFFDIMCLRTDVALFFEDQRKGVLMQLMQCAGCLDASGCGVATTCQCWS